MKISVTEEHIIAGFVGSCTRCPVALAISHALHQAGISPLPIVFVDSNTIEIGSDQYNTPESASDFIKEFDNFCRPAPFEFELPCK